MWTEYELLDIVNALKLVTKKASWYNIPENLKTLLIAEGIGEDFLTTDAFQGEKKLLAWITNPDIKKALIKIIKNILSEEF